MKTKLPNNHTNSSGRGSLRRRFNRQRMMPRFISLLFLAPWIIGFFAFALTPLITMARYSISNVIFRPGGTILQPVGLENFNEVLFIQPDFRMQVPAYLRLVLLLLPIIMVFSILLATLLNSITKGKGFYRAIYFLPVILLSPPLLSDLIAIDAFELQGLRDFFIFDFIIENFPAQFSGNFMFIMDNVVMCLWFSGVQLLIFLSGMQKIDRSLYEAAEVEGASAWQIFWKITIPVLKPFILLNTIYTLVDLSTSSLNPISNIITDAMYRVDRGFGFSAAVTWIYLGIEVIFLIAVFLLLGRDNDAIRTARWERQERRRIRKARRKAGAARREAHA